MSDDQPRPEPWTVTESAVVLANRWIRVRADTCVDAGGRTIAPYYVHEAGEWISVLALDTDGHAIVVEEYRHGAGIVALGTIGGGVEVGESPRDAAQRELREETGHEAGEIIDLGATWANFGNQTNRVHHFLARDCRSVSAQSLDDGETIAVRILPLAGLGEHLTQSYHQLTWYKALAHVWTADQSSNSRATTSPLASTKTSQPASSSAIGRPSSQVRVHQALGVCAF